MDIILLPHPSIEECYLFQDARLDNYMVLTNPILSDELDMLFKKPGYVPITLPITVVHVNDRVLQVFPKHDGLTALPKTHFRRFFTSVVLAVEFLAGKELVHTRLWDKSSFWVHNGNYRMRWFIPSSSGSVQRSLKDAFILACNLMFSLKESTFTLLEPLLRADDETTSLMTLYTAIADFTGDFDSLYSILALYKPAEPVIKFPSEVALSSNKAINLIQKCILRSSFLI